jgi:Na+-transporting NADH:ubiquinone oxidoreductase subunit NqrD
MQFTENTVVVDELEDDEGAELLDELVDVLLDDVELSSEPTKVVVGLIEEFDPASVVVVVELDVVVVDVVAVDELVVVFGFGPSNA